ncbi:MAG: type I-E CRISPR-associated protein Cse2/CasB [Selenomonadales bacterium]|nr:type I-E CRISPR-associated protein Cse2/CasB [Selenomonadales bacterium]
MSTEKSGKSHEQVFVDYVLGRMEDDSAFGAALRRADNPATEYQAWEYLAAWCNIEREVERRPYATIASAIARAKPAGDGSLGIGEAIAACYKEGNASDSAKSKLRRLLACDSTEEACVVLRPLLSLISSHGVRLGYGKLLNELTHFGDKVKARWAVSFYGRRWNDDRFGTQPESR